MAIRNVSYKTINLFLVAMMVLCLIAALTAGTLAIAWTGRPQGDTATTIAEAFAWLFAAALFTSFAIALFEEHDDRRAERRAKQIPVA
ncbi:hypothetical protein MXD81_45170 [Microbacteriaceae bacterium K1510]|nr:hypothetical protein [Microbacteriaceae bacterium K1510]